MATDLPGNTTTGDYVKAPETVQPQMPVEDQLNQLKIAAKGKVNEFVDRANQAANDPYHGDKASDERLQQDVDATAQDAANSYTKALNQLGEAYHMVESTGKQAAHQLGVASDQTAANAQELTGAAREQAQQRSEETKLQVQSGQSALQQGIAKVHDAVSAGAAVANQTLQEGSNPSTTASEPRGYVHSGDAHAPTLFQSLGNVISQTAQSVRDAFVTPSPTATQSHVTPVSTNLPVTHPPAQSFSESIGQTAASLTDAIKSTWSSPREYPHATSAPPVPPGDAPRSATE